MAALVPDVQAEDGWQSAVRAEAAAAQALYKPAAVQFAEQSSADQALEVAGVALELPAARLAQLAPRAAHSLQVEEPQEDSPLAAPRAELLVLLESLAAQQLWLGSPVWVALPEPPDAESPLLMARELELPALRPGEQPALLLEPGALRDAVEQEAEPEQLPVAAFR